MSATQTEVLAFADGREIARHILGIGVHTFGSSDECGVQIEADLVAPRHSQLTVGEDGTVIVEDLGSANGTFVDGQRIAAPTPVAPNQIIQIGAAQLLLLQRSADAIEDSTVAADHGAAPAEFSQTVRYELGVEIAKGGMGAVLTARQPAIRREVALKVMLRNASAHDRLRFIEEAQITGQLEHPNIVPVHDLALNEHGQPYYTMKLVRGGTLREILKLLAQGNAAAIAKYPLAALLTIFQKVCDAVAFAHARGVIHRDLKPANIMVGEYGEVLVMDWGLAKVIAGRDGAAGLPSTAVVGTAREDQREVFATLDGAVMGTPRYMSPEQAHGEVASLDQRSDIFSLGAILYELVTLLPPFPGKTTREILSNVKSGHFVLPNARLRATDAPHPRHLPSGVIPDSLEAVISKALAVDRSQRYQRVTDFQADLTAYQGGFATSAENAGAWKQFTLLIKRHKALSTAIAASVLLIVGITAAFTTKVVAERNQTAVQRDRAVIERTNAVAANAENLLHLHEASMADYAVASPRLGDDTHWGDGIAHLTRALDLDPKNPLPAAELFGAIAFRPDNANLLRCVLRHQAQVASASFSPDGSRIVTASSDHTARLWDVVTGRQVGMSMRHPSWVASARFSPDGKRVVTACRDKTARLWDAITGDPIGKPMHLGGPDESESHSLDATFSPDGARILTIDLGKTAQVWDAATGKPLSEPMRHAHEVLSASFSLDGARIVTTTGDYAGAKNDVAQMWDAATSKPLGEPMRHAAAIMSASFSPDGTHIVTASDDKTARLWDAATGMPLAEPMRHPMVVTNASFSPDGTRIITTCQDKTARVWDAATGLPLGEPIRHEIFARNASFSPDGARIVSISGDNTVRLWDAATGKPLGEPMHHENGVTSASFSPDGTHIVTASTDNRARVWDAATGRPAGMPMRHDSALRCASFSPDGTRIVTASMDNTARLWDAASAKPRGVPMHHRDLVLSARFSPDSARIVTASMDHTARIWDAATGQTLGHPMRHERWVMTAAFSPDGSRILTTSGDYTEVNAKDNMARVWDAATGDALGEPMRYDAGSNFRSPSFSPDGKRILTTNGKQARVWDAATSKPLSDLIGSNNYDFSPIASFSPDGRRVVSGNSVGIARLWDAATGELFGEPMRNGGKVSCASFSPDGTRIVTSSGGTARLWNAATCKPLCKPMLLSFPYGDWPYNPEASFSPDGKRILATSGNNAVRLWDAATGKPVGGPLRHEGAVADESFSPDGTRILTACDDETARLWGVKSLLNLPSLTPEWVREWARAVAGWKFDAEGVMQPMPGEERVKILYASHNGDDPWSRLARWMASEPAQRTIDPDSPQTCREIAERERDFTDRKSLESALRYDPSVPLARLMLADFEENPQRAAFLRDYDLKRMPGDPALWERAVQLLHDQNDDARALQALQKLEKLAPEKAAELRKDEARQKQEGESRAVITDINKRIVEQKSDEATPKLVAAENPTPPKVPSSYLGVLRFYILIGRKDFQVAYRLAERISDAHMDDADLQNDLAWEIISHEKVEQRGLETAEKLATRANDAAGGNDCDILDTLARVLFMEGKKEAAIRMQEQVVTMTTADETPSAKKTLENYRQSILPKAE